MSATRIKSAAEALTDKSFATLGEAKVKIKNWLSDKYIDADAKLEVVKLIEEKNSVELRDAFYRELEFGTGGLRGIIGAGNNRMNKYVVKRATQGLANYICKQGKSAMQKGVAIAYDSRHMSDVFAREAATTLAASGIKVFIFPTLNTTPALSFAVRHLNCISGICVTASHNPPQYNGFKVYWEDGAQIIPPVDAGILEEVFNVKTFSEIKTVDYEKAKKDKMISLISDDVVEEWYKAIDSLRIYKNITTPIKIVYTPLHGTGAVHAKAVLKRWGFNDVFVVPEQEKPDGNFPTVKKPNPEEPAALKLAFEHASRLNADLILATDPDSDRLAVVVRDPKFAHGALEKQSIGDYVFLNGNQTGALMIDYILSGLTTQGRLKPTHKIIKTIVTSELHRLIAKSHNVETFDTLTGFKWIAGLLREWEVTEKPNHDYLFGTEESFGYMPGTYVRDKDGIGALCQAAEMVAFHKQQNKTICERLFELFKTFGAWQESLINVDLVGEEGANKIKRMMENMRKNPKADFCGVKVNKMLDYKIGAVYNQTDSKIWLMQEQKLAIPSSDVLQFELVDGSKISMRPSGTEPKIKFYISVCTRHGKGDVYNTTLAKIEALNAEINAFVAGVE